MKSDVATTRGKRPSRSPSPPGTQHNAELNIGFASQGDDPAVDGAAGFGPQAPHEFAYGEDRPGIATLAHHLVDPRRAQPWVLRQGVADERQIRVDDAGPPHPGRDAWRLALDRGADRLTVEAELGRDGPDLPVLGVVQAPDLGALRGRDHPSSLSPRCAARASEPAIGSSARRPRNAWQRGLNRGGVRDGESGRSQRCGGRLIHHAAAAVAVGALLVAMVETTLGTLLMSRLGSPHRPATAGRPAAQRAVGMAAITRYADGEQAAAVSAGLLA